MIHNPETKRSVEKSTRPSTLLGAFSLGIDRANVISTIRPGPYSFFYAPGWHTNGEVIAKNFDKHVEHLGSTHYGVHPERKYSLETQKEAWLKARKKDGHRPAKIYAQSKGVLTVSHAFADENFRYEFGEVDSVCFDSGVSSRHDIRKPKYFAVLAGLGIPVTETMDRMNASVMRKMLPSEYDYDKEVVTEEEAHENSAASAETGLEACKTQLSFLWSHDIADLDLSVFGQTIPNKKIISSVKDNLVKVARSSAVINESYGGGFEHWVDTTRRSGDHATGTERPQGVVDALMNQHSHRYRVISIGGAVTRTAFQTLDRL